MSSTLGRPFVPVDLNTEFVALERRVGVTEMRERGIGRAAWRKVISTRGRAVYDGAVPGWRRLNDGRVEIRGRLRIVGTLAQGTTVLHIPAECCPPGSSSVSATAPCSASGTNPGTVRVDFTVATGDDGSKVTAVIAYPSASGLTEWIGFDHVIYDQNLYIDVLPPVDYGEEPVAGRRSLVVITRGGEQFSVIPGTTPVLIPQPTPRDSQ